MHICYVADARSPIAKNWISYFVARGMQVTVISSYPCASDDIPGARVVQFPFALASLARPSGQTSNPSLGTYFRSRIRSAVRSESFLGAAHRVRTWIAPFDLRRKAREMSALIGNLKPDVVHAMRLPFEGFIAAASIDSSPLLLSIWGNDFTLFADRSRKLAALTHSALQRVDALHCDCNRDLNLAFDRGFSRTKPWRVLPGNGGVQEFVFKTVADRALLAQFDIPENAPLVINPRGLRSYVHSEAFFKAIPLILAKVPETVVLAIGTIRSPAERWIRRLNIGGSVRLLPTVSREQLASLFAAAQLSVSPSSHDGTPNTLLEAMATGCFPIAGDIESLREWIADGENGFLCDPRDPNALADCVIRALLDSNLRERAGVVNRKLVRDRAEYCRVMENAEAFYYEVVARAQSRRAFPLRSCSNCLSPELATRKAL